MCRGEHCVQGETLLYVHVRHMCQRAGGAGWLDAETHSQLPAVD